MTDKLISADDPRWKESNPTKGSTRYRHLLDGNARELDCRDYDYNDVDNFRIAISHAARVNGLKSRSHKVSEYILLFQVTGERK